MIATICSLTILLLNSCVAYSIGIDEFLGCYKGHEDRMPAQDRYLRGLQAAIDCGTIVWRHRLHWNERKYSAILKYT
jgi:hypothetical protein